MIGNTPKFLTYEVGDSPLHRLDPRTKLMSAGAIVLAALIAHVPFGMIVVYALGAVAGLSARHLLPSLWRLLRPLVVLIFLFGLILVVTTPGKALVHFWIVVPTRDGVDLAIRLGLQALLIVYTTSLVSLTTPPLEIAGALQWCFGWLERFKVPVRDIISMVGIGLTFVPLLIEETQKVIAAQRARGANLGANALLEEESMAALLIPLLLANLRRGSDLAESMEARLYDTGPRSSLQVHSFQSIDAVAAVVVIAFAAGATLVSLGNFLA